jgi:hypothetical protein
LQGGEGIRREMSETKKITLDFDRQEYETLKELLLTVLIDPNFKQMPDERANAIRSVASRFLPSWEEL